MIEGISEIISGSIAGVVGKIFEYPFDTAKVRLQTQSLSNPQYKGAIDCLVKTIKNEGLLGMYKGVSAPILAAAVENAVLFGTFNMFDHKLHGSINDATLRALACGSLSGLAASFILTPIELVKCQVQVDSNSRKANIWPIIKHTFQTGGLVSFWRGQMGTALREGGGSAAWFGTYFALKDDYGSLLAGALAGVSYNLSLFPADSIKSRMQTASLNNTKQNLSFFQTGWVILKQNGVRGLYRGALITCVRAGPSNAVIFTVHEYLKKTL